MRLFRQLVLICAVAVAALGLAHPSAAAESPEFLVDPYETGLGRTVETELDLTLPAGNAALGKVSFYAPTGYSAKLDQPLGAAIGEVSGKATAAGQKISVGGAIVADLPSSFAGSSCSPGTHAAVWALRLTLGPRVLSVPVFVDPTGPEEQVYGSIRLSACFAAPSVPEALGGMPLGAQISELALHFDAVFRNPIVAKYHVWRAIVTPYDAAGTLNVATPYELRSSVPVPQRLALKSRYDKARKQAVITGSLAEAGHVQPNIIVYILVGQSFSTLRQVARVKTAKNGTFTVRRRVLKTALLWAYTPVYFDRCRDEPALVTGGCLRQTWSPTYAELTRVVVPKPKR